MMRVLTVFGPKTELCNFILPLILSLIVLGLSYTLNDKHQKKEQTEKSHCVMASSFHNLPSVRITLGLQNSHF